MTKNCVDHAPYLRKHISWLSFMVHMCKMICPGIFFSFKILIFQVVNGLKVQKMAQHFENVCRTLYFRNHISYDLYLWYTCMYKRIISLGILIIRIIRWGWWKGKKWPKMTKNFVCLTLYFRNRTSCDCDFWCMCVKWLYLQQIFSFSQILIFGVFRGTKGKKWAKITNFSLFCYISQELEIISLRFW